MTTVVILAVISIMAIASLIVYAVWLFRQHTTACTIGGVCAVVAAVGIICIWVLVYELTQINLPPIN